jgi:hypothetical protein
MNSMTECSRRLELDLYGARSRYELLALLYALEGGKVK